MAALYSSSGLQLHFILTGNHSAPPGDISFTLESFKDGLYGSCADASKFGIASIRLHYPGFLILDIVPLAPGTDDARENNPLHTHVKVSHVTEDYAYKLVTIQGIARDEVLLLQGDLPAGDEDTYIARISWSQMPYLIDVIDVIQLLATMSPRYKIVTRDCRWFAGVIYTTLRGTYYGWDAEDIGDRFWQWAMFNLTVRAPPSLLKRFAEDRKRSRDLRVKGPGHIAST